MSGFGYVQVVTKGREPRDDHESKRRQGNNRSDYRDHIDSHTFRLHQ
mgnify:CR=1 FL=1